MEDITSSSQMIDSVLNAKESKPVKITGKTLDAQVENIIQELDKIFEEL